MIHMEQEADARAAAVAATIRAERAAARLSQNELASRAGIPRPTYLRYERGDRNIPVITAIQLAEALGMTFGEFARRVEDRLPRTASASAPEQPEQPRREHPLTMQEIKQQRLLEAAMPVDIAADDRPWAGDGADDWEPC